MSKPTRQELPERREAPVLINDWVYVRGVSLWDVEEAVIRASFVRNN